MGKLAGVAIEVGAKDGVQLAERRVAAILVEEVLSEEGKLALIAEEALQSRRQCTALVGEGLAQDLFDLGGRLLV